MPTGEVWGWKTFPHSEFEHFSWHPDVFLVNGALQDQQNWADFNHLRWSICVSLPQLAPGSRDLSQAEKRITFM